MIALRPNQHRVSTISTVRSGGAAVAELHVELVSADRTVWSGDATMLVARTTEGELGVLPGHTPILGALVAGEVRIAPVSGSAITATIDGGFLSVEHDRVVVVAEQVSMGSSSGPDAARAAAH